MEAVTFVILGFSVLTNFLLGWQLLIIVKRINFLNKSNNVLALFFKIDFHGITKKSFENLRYKLKSDVDNLIGLCNDTKNIESSVDELTSRFNSFYDELGPIINSINKINSKASIQQSAVEDMIKETNAMITNQVESNGDVEINNYKIETTTDNMKQLISSIEEISRYISETENLSEHLRTTSQSSKEKFRKYMYIINELSVGSTKIEEIIKTINDISDKTNILSINASIEAARAGKYGKGFAVVSKEIRNLSRQVNDAASQITEIIKDNTNKINLGISASIESNHALNKILEGIETTSSNIRKINTGIKEQDSKITETIELINDLQSFSDKLIEQTKQQVEESGKAITVLDKLKEHAHIISNETLDLTSKNNNMFNKIEDVMELLGIEQEANNGIIFDIRNLINNVGLINNNLTLYDVNN